MKKLFTLLFFVILTFSVNAQKNEPSKATNVGKITNYRYVPSIATQIKEGTFIPAGTEKKAARPKMQDANITIPGKGYPKGEDPLVHLQKNVIQRKGKAASLVFDADTTPQAGVTDPSGAVGPNHYLASWNFGFRIFDKSGNPLTPEASLATIFPGNSIGDAVMLYDAAADRFVFTEFDSSPNGFNIAVSAGPDPVNDGWHVYTTGFGTGAFPDYTKFSIWSDGYYVTANIGAANRVFVVERDVMIAGGANPQFVGLPLPGIATSGFYSPQIFNVGNSTLPAAGNATVVYLQDDAWGGVAQDHLKLWTINVDWNNTANSTISAAQQIITAAFTSVFDGGSFSNLTQPGGTAVDAMQATIMNQAQFRKFATHNSVVFNFVVDAAAGAPELAAVRWYELRQANDSAPWTIFQEGTYTAPDNKHAWAASMAMDNQGNIGMAYTSMGGTANQRIGINYTGRLANDPMNTMGIAEELIAQGSSNNPATRYADYVHLTIDPTDDKTFWHISEYFNPNRRDVVGVFKIAPDTTNDTGVISIDSPSNGILGANEDVVVTVFNYGNDPQSNIPVNLTVDGTVVATGTLAGPLGSSSSAQFTFTSIDFSTEGHTYVVTSCTTLTGDEDANNDCVTTNIAHLNSADIGVTEITAPVNGENLGMESIVITIENFGGTDQSSFDVSYTLDGAAAVTEVVSGPLTAGSTMSYTFTVPGDFSAVASHTLVATTSLAGDADTTNDSTSVTVINLSCLTNSNTTSQPVGPNSGTVTTSTITFTNDFIVNDVNVTIDIDHTFDSDLEIKLVAPNGTEVILSSGQGGNGDNFTNTVFDDAAATPISGGSAPFTGSFQPDGSLATLNNMQSIGDWDLVITDNANQDGGNLNNWMLQLCGDVTAAVTDTLFNDSEFIVSTLENNQFEISVNTTEINDRLTFSVTNMIGQKLVSSQIENTNGVYKYELDMSYATPGLYILRLGNSKLGNVKKIIVK